MALTRGVSADPAVNVDDDLPVGVGGGLEVAGDGGVRPAGGGHDVEVEEHLGAVDRDVELPLPGHLVLDLGEVQPDRVVRPGGQPRQGVGEPTVPRVGVVAHAGGLVDGHGGRARHPAGVDVGERC